MKISTKTGDHGKTFLFSRLSQKPDLDKNALVVQVLGSIDEVNSFLGGAISFAQEQELSSKLQKVQEDLFRISAILAGAKLDFSKTKIKCLEKEIDTLEKRLPPLAHFIFPGGVPAAAFLHVARTIARRAERELVTLNKNEIVDLQILAYFNRLSDFLFVLARAINTRAGFKEIIWQGKRKKKNF